MVDPHKLVERVREVSEQSHDGEPELRLRDRTPRSEAQRERAENAAADPGPGDAPGDAEKRR